MTDRAEEIINDNNLLGELVTTADGSMTIRHPGHLETYHSSAGAETEARELYIHSSGILKCFDQGVPTVVLDVGLGLAYNAFATFDAWLAAKNPGDLFIVSLENSPMLVASLATGEAPWSAAWSKARKNFAASLKQEDANFVTRYHHANGAVCNWRVLIGDARDTILSSINGNGHRFNFVWQDPFSPEKNPDMWGADWFRQLNAVCSEDVTLVTYSVARKVRDALTDAGWHCERFKTPVREKKHWLRAKLSGSLQG